MDIVGLVLAALVGLSLGMLGGGGSILTVPIFVYVLGFDAKEAIAMSLVVVGVTSLFGAARHWRAGNVDLRIAFIFGAVAMIGTFLGARLSIFLSGSVQLLLFAVVMLAAAVFMFRGRPAGAQEQATQGVAFADLPLVQIGMQGFAVGLLTGLVGVGGGFLIVPALVLLGGVPMKQAVGTSLLVIALNAAAGFVGYLDQVSIAWGTVVTFTLIAIGGIFVGTTLVRSIPQDLLRRAFAGFLVMMGAFILIQNSAALL